MYQGVRYSESPLYIYTYAMCQHHSSLGLHVRSLYLNVLNSFLTYSHKNNYMLPLMVYDENSVVQQD